MVWLCQRLSCSLQLYNQLVFNYKINHQLFWWSVYYSNLSSDCSFINVNISCFSFVFWKYWSMFFGHIIDKTTNRLIQKIFDIFFNSCSPNQRMIHSTCVYFEAVVFWWCCVCFHYLQKLNYLVLQDVVNSVLNLTFIFQLVCSGDSGVWGLKKNFALLELLERLQNGATNQSGMAEDALKGMGEVRRSWFHSFVKSRSLLLHPFNSRLSSSTSVSFAVTRTRATRPPCTAPCVPPTCVPSAPSSPTPPARWPNTAGCRWLTSLTRRPCARSIRSTPSSSSAWRSRVSPARSCAVCARSTASTRDIR